ncbi:MAG: carboxypeptidase-like regulatory domain-containing protein [Chitinophagaceae bacterium]|nr:carboxypeptidase-like regulatory domain-containing protein [Chitinophagaceae bacterium]
MFRYCLSILLLLTALSSAAQLYRVSGVIMDPRKEPLQLASIEVKETHKGAVSRDDGSYEFYLERGKYDLVISMVGFKTKVVTIYINNEDIKEDISMEAAESSNLGEVIVKAKIRDRAEDLIRNAIRTKDSILSGPGDYSCNIYIKAFQQDSGYVTKKKAPAEDTVATDNFEGMSLAEVSLRYDRNRNGQIKEERIGVNKRGNTDNLFYMTTTDGDFNIYNNLVRSHVISPIPFVSPVSYSGLVAYRFKTIKIDRTQKPKVYTIAVRPRQLSNATVEGEITIQDSTWSIQKAVFRIPQAHMPEFDYFEVSEEYGHAGNGAWVITRQEFNYYNKAKGGKRYGETTALYSGYELNKTFKKGYFGNEVSSTSVEAYEKDSSFWKSVRGESLTMQQAKYAHYQDSIYQYQRSEAYLDSMDKVLNRITWKKMLIFGQIFNDHKKQRMWILPPITSLIQPIAFGGTRLHVGLAFRKTFQNRKNLEFEVNTSYGFRNQDVNGTIEVSHMYNPFSRGTLKLEVGRDFQFIYPGDAWVNILKRSNIYLNNAFQLTHDVELFNGIHLMNKVEFALRRSVANYKVGPNADTLFGIPNEPAVDFDPYNATYNEVKVYFTPGQKYIREPHEKIYLGSKLPTFYVIWRKGIPGIFQSEVDFDYLEFGLEQKINLGVAGNTSYIFKTANFLNRNDLRIIDYKFMRRGDPIFFQDPHKAFQALDSTFPVFQRFWQGNLVHEFNGALVNKIPFMKKLKIQEIAGGGILLAKERGLRYIEVFAGLERVFKWPFNPLSKVKLGIYVVGSGANKYNNPVQFKVGLTTWDRFRNKWR